MSSAQPAEEQVFEPENFVQVPESDGEMFTLGVSDNAEWDPLMRLSNAIIRSNSVLEMVTHEAHLANGGEVPLEDWEAKGYQFRPQTLNAMRKLFIERREARELVKLDLEDQMRLHPDRTNAWKTDPEFQKQVDVLIARFGKDELEREKKLQSELSSLMDPQELNEFVRLMFKYYGMVALTTTLGAEAFQMSPEQHQEIVRAVNQASESIAMEASEDHKNQFVRKYTPDNSLTHHRPIFDALDPDQLRLFLRLLPMNLDTEAKLQDHLNEYSAENREYLVGRLTVKP